MALAVTATIGVRWFGPALALISSVAYTSTSSQQQRQESKWCLRKEEGEGEKVR
jgi:hypothetical protein